MELSRLILLYDDDFHVEDLTQIYGVVYMNYALKKQFPWWIRRFSIDGEYYAKASFDVPNPGVSTVIGVPLSKTAHEYRQAIFGQRWIEDVNYEIVSTFPPVREVSVQGDDAALDIDLMRILQNV